MKFHQPFLNASLAALALFLLPVKHSAGQSIRFTTNVVLPVPAGGYGHGASFGAFTRNGRPSIFAIIYGHANNLYDNNGGGFDDIAAAAGVQFGTDHDRGMAAADYDNDGDVDIYISAGYTGNVFWQNNGDDTFSEITSSSGAYLNGQGQGVAWGDVNRDGLLDLFVAQTDGGNHLYMQSGGRFYDNSGDLSSQSGSLQPVIFDVDGDGNVDILVTRVSGQNNLLYINGGGGSFSEQAQQWGIGAASADCQGATVGDYDRDGDLDIFIANFKGDNLLFRNMGGYFDEVGGAAKIRAGAGGNRGAVFGDFNDDGWPDIYVTRSGNNTMLQNNGDGAFSDVSGSSGTNDGSDGYSPSIADFDNDGDTDIFFTNTGQNSVVLENLGPFNHWIEFRLRGGSSNLNGIGAQLTAWQNGKPQKQAVIAGQGYLGTGSDLTVHFGLGNNSQLDSLMVQWPSGSRDRYYQLAANQKTTLYEGNAPPADRTPPQISQVAANNLTMSGATIAWQTDENADAQVEYGRDTNYGSFSALDGNLATSHTIALSNLAAGTTYHYRARSKDAAGNLAISNDFTFTTARDTQTPVLSNVAPSNIQMNSVAIVWNSDEPADSQVEYGLSTNYGLFSTLDTSLVKLHNVGLAGLAANTVYHFRVRSKDAAGNLAVSTGFTFKSAPDTKAPSISALLVSEVAVSAVKLTWSTDEPASSQVEYSIDSTSLNLAFSDTSFVQSHVVTLSNLQAFTAYYYRVIAKDKVGNATATPKASFKTLPTIAKLTTLSGQAQSGHPNGVLALPLTVSVLNSAGARLPNIPVEFRVIAGGGQVLNAPACDSAVCVVATDQNGLASMKWRLGKIDSQKVQATVLNKTELVANFSATLLSITSVEENAAFIPATLALRQHPNPFRQVTQFELALPQAGYISLKIFDLHGREVITLAEGFKAAGRFFVHWEGKDQTQREIASGSYFAVLRYAAANSAATVTEKRQVLYLK